MDFFVQPRIKVIVLVWPRATQFTYVVRLARLINHTGINGGEEDEGHLVSSPFKVSSVDFNISPDRNQDSNYFCTLARKYPQGKIVKISDFGDVREMICTCSVLSVLRDTCSSGRAASQTS